MNIPKQIVIHKSGFKVWNTREEFLLYSDFLTYQKRKLEKQDTTGFHFVIDRNGTLVADVPLDQEPVNAEGHNKNVVAICAIGEFTLQEPTEAQINALKILILKLCSDYKIDTSMHHIFCHCDYRDPPGDRYCPGKYLHKQIPGISNWVREMIKKGVR